MKQAQPVPKDRPFVEGPPKAQSGTVKREIDDSIWPLLNGAISVRAIAEKANTSTATVGRSRKRWESATRDQVVSQPMRQETPPEMTTGQAQETTA